MHGKGRDFVDGCPYCRSIYTVDYSDKNVGAKLHYNYVMKDNKYKVRTFLIDFAFCLILSSIYYVSTGRTFTIFDILKILGLALVFSLILFYAFYMLDSYIVTQRVIKEKEKQHQKQIKFWNDMSGYNISKQKFFNNLNSELNNLFYDDSVQKNKNVIDFDILEYEDYDYFFDEKNRINIKVKLNIRIIEYNLNHIESNIREMNLVLVQNEILEKEKGIYMVRCHGCGASLDIMKKECEYCGCKIHYLQSWYIKDVDIKE